MAFGSLHSTHQETPVLIPQSGLSLCACVPDRDALNAFGVVHVEFLGEPLKP